MERKVLVLLFVAAAAFTAVLADTTVCGAAPDNTVAYGKGPSYDPNGGVGTACPSGTVITNIVVNDYGFSKINGGTFSNCTWQNQDCSLKYTIGGPTASIPQDLSRLQQAATSACLYATSCDVYGGYNGGSADANQEFTFQSSFSSQTVTVSDPCQDSVDIKYLTYALTCGVLPTTNLSVTLCGAAPDNTVAYGQGSGYDPTNGQGTACPTGSYISNITINDYGFSITTGTNTFSNCTWQNQDCSLRYTIGGPAPSNPLDLLQFQRAATAACLNQPYCDIYGGYNGQAATYNQEFTFKSGNNVQVVDSSDPCQDPAHIKYLTYSLTCTFGTAPAHLFGGSQVTVSAAGVVTDQIGYRDCYVIGTDANGNTIGTSGFKLETSSTSYCCTQRGIVDNDMCTLVQGCSGVTSTTSNFVYGTVSGVGDCFASCYGPSTTASLSIYVGGSLSQPAQYASVSPNRDAIILSGDSSSQIYSNGFIVVPEDVDRKRQKRATQVLDSSFACANKGSVTSDGNGDLICLSTNCFGGSSSSAYFFYSGATDATGQDCYWGCTGLGS